MPQFRTVSLDEARTKPASGKRAELLQEYAGYLDRLTAGQAGSLKAAPGETTQAIRRRLGAAAKSAGKQISVRRSEDTIYFWIADERGPRKRGRPRKV
ncbi:MAG: hypothetical protein O3B84_05600 [Chloroflexi bacterium]|nr:hypothetical protein [Chloroflexota bacterium]